MGTFASDTLTGGTGSDVLYGLAGDDLLVGGAASDTYYGGAGADAFVIGGDGEFDIIADFHPEEGDRIYLDVIGLQIDYTNHQVNGLNRSGLLVSGHDAAGAAHRVFIVGGHFQQDEIRNAVILGTASSPPGRPILTGDDGDNALSGSIQAVTFEGRGGDDILTGGRGDDSLLGGRGNDRLDGGRGADHLVGGAGDDHYVIDEQGDVITESAGNGHDTVESWASVQLGAHVEDLVLRGVFALDGTGNASANVLRGNAGGNVLSGLGGDDLIEGGAGHDVIDGGAGWDTVEVSGARSDYRLLEIDGGFLLKGLEGRDTLTGVEEIRFADGSRIELLRMYAEDRLLETLPAAPGDKAFDPDAWVTPPADDVVPGKDLSAGEEPEIMPGLDDGLPLLLPAGTGVWRADSRLWLDEGLVDRPTAWDDILA